MKQPLFSHFTWRTLACAFIGAAAPGFAGTLTVNFNSGSPVPLVQTYGPNDNPAQANAAYTVNRQRPGPSRRGRDERAEPKGVE